MTAINKAHIFIISFIVFFIYVFAGVGYSEASAQVVINEVFPNPLGDEAGAEWVELYNVGDVVATLEGCSLFLDDSSATQKVVFGTNDFVDKFKVISWDNTWLSNTGDFVKLACPQSSDEVAYGNQSGSTVEAPAEGKTIGRFPDGMGGLDN